MMNSIVKGHFELGKQKFYRYDRKGAVDEFYKALKSEPDNPEMLGWLAITLILLGKYKSAKNIQKKFGCVECAEFFIANGLLYSHQDNDEEKAIEQFSKALSIDPQHSFALVRRGILFTFLGKKLEAISDLKLALELEHSSYNWGMYGFILKEFEEEGEAMFAFEKAIELDPENPRARCFIGEMNQKFGDFDQALIDITKAIEIQPEFWRSWYVRGCLKADCLNDFKGAIDDLSKSIEVDPDNVLLWTTRGVVRENFGDPIGALADYDKAIKIKPNYGWALYKRGRNQRIYQQNNKKAIHDFQRAIKVDPKYSWCWAEMGCIQEDFKKHNEALKYYTRAIELKPENAWFWMLRGSLRLNLGNKKTALDDFNKAIQVNDKYSWAYSKRASFFRSVGNYELSIADQIRYYDLEGMPETNYIDPKIQDIFIGIRDHYNNIVKPEMARNNEKLIEYWVCTFQWGVDTTQSLSQGRPMFGHSGSFGLGYICLSNTFLRIISVGHLSKKNEKIFGIGAGKKMFFAMLGNFDMRSVEKEDRLWTVSFSDIQNITKDDDGFHITTPFESWQAQSIFSNNNDDEYMHMALELARKGNLRRIIDVGNLTLLKESIDSDDEIFEKIERLASMCNRKIISEKEFEQKKKELLARL